VARFGKKQPETQIPELQEYYATQKQQSPVVAWLMAIASLIVTVAILIGFFYGGRWLYRKITNNDETKPTTTSQTDTNKPTSTQNGATDADKNKDTNTSGTVTAPSTSNGISGSIGGSTTTPAQGVSPSQPTSTNQSAVAATTNIPNTGIELNIALVIGIIALGYGVRLRTLRKK
jgi:cytoskeletal protein RodZ